MGYGGEGVGGRGSGVGVLGSRLSDGWSRWACGWGAGKHMRCMLGAVCVGVYGVPGVRVLGRRVVDV